MRGQLISKGQKIHRCRPPFNWFWRFKPFATWICDDCGRGWVWSSDWMGVSGWFEDEVVTRILSPQQHAKIWGDIDE